MTNQIVLHYRHPITRFGSSAPSSPNITVLDASADAKLLGRFFQIRHLQRINAPRKAHVVQCNSVRGSTTSFVPSRNKDPASRREAQRRLKDVTGLVTRLVADKRKVLVVGPSSITGNPAKGTPPLLKLPKRVAQNTELAHFNAVRGIDGWKDCDAAVIIGRNEPPVEAVEGIARALFHDDAKPLQLPGEWTTAPRGYRVANEQAGVDTIVHLDPRVQAVLEQMRECESVQAIDRLRLIHSPIEKLVIVLSNIPLDIDVDELRNWDDTIHGTRLERAWDPNRGVLPLQPAWLAAAHPDLWASEGAAKKDVQRAACRKGQITNEISIRNLSLFGFLYKKPASRRWSVCLAATDEPGVVQRELSRVLGEEHQVRPLSRDPGLE